MDMLLALTIYAAAYARCTRQMAGSDWAWQWMETMTEPTWRDATSDELEQHARQSGEWATWGYGPVGAAPHIAAGRDPIRAAQYDDAAAGLRPQRPTEIRRAARRG